MIDIKFEEVGFNKQNFQKSQNFEKNSKFSKKSKFSKILFFSKKWKKLKVTML